MLKIGCKRRAVGEESIAGGGPNIIYRYVVVKQILFSSEIGRYTAFGIAAQKQTPEGWRQTGFVQDVCTDARNVQRLAQLCTQEQLEPVHLLDVVEDYIADPHMP